jgi:hypothetical protein
MSMRERLPSVEQYQGPRLVWANLSDWAWQQYTDQLNEERLPLIPEDVLISFETPEEFNFTIGEYFLAQQRLLKDKDKDYPKVFKYVQLQDGRIEVREAPPIELALSTAILQTQEQEQPIPGTALILQRYKNVSPHKYLLARTMLMDEMNTIRMEKERAPLPQYNLNRRQLPEVSPLKFSMHFYEQTLRQ